MGTALFIVAERELPGADLQVNGKALGRHTLDRLARRLGVRPLMEFFSISPEEAASEYEGDLGELPGNLPAEQWFPSEEGLATVRTMLAYLEVHPNEVPGAQAALMDDLRQFETVLSLLAAAGVRWHLAVDR